MKTLLAAAGAIIVGYLVFAEWLDSQDDTWLDEAHHVFDDYAYLPHPWSSVDGKDPRRHNA